MSAWREGLQMAPSGGSRQCSKTSAMEGKPDGQRMGPEPLLLTLAV